MTEISVLKTYFGYHPSNERYAGLGGFSRELKELTPDERHDLAVLAADALGETLG